MKKIEKEEQLKKKLEQTMEEKMAADSKTVEGESAVVKAEEGNTATEQEPEAAPALSEEELNAMYERFQQRLQKEGLADAEGNPTEKTLAADLQCFFCRVAFRVRESFLLESLLEALVHCVQFFL